MASLGATQGCSVAIIAGGSSRRMGTDKARLVVAGEPLLARLARQLHALGPLTIVGGDQSLLALAEPSIGSNAVIEHVLDEYPGEGPLGALITAMRRTAGTALALVACDLPDLDSGTVLHMLEQHLATDADVTVPVVHNAPQWHVTLWNPEVLLLLESCFSTGERSLWRAARALRTTSVVFADDSKFRDLDSPEDLAGYENRQPPGMSDSMGVYDRQVSIPEISVDELAALLGSNSPVSIIDVREPHEFAAGHAPGAKLLPLGDIVERAGELPAGPLHVICGSGVRSLQACEALAPLGHDVTNIAGGTSGWIAAGHSVDTGRAPE